MSLTGEEARKVFNEAQAMLKSIKANNSLRCKGVVGFFRAASVGDDIQLYGEDGEVIATLYGLRQQVCTLSHDLFITLLQQSITPFSILARTSGTPDCLPGDCCHLTIEAQRRKKKANKEKRNYWENLSI